VPFFSLSLLFVRDFFFPRPLSHFRCAFFSRRIPRALVTLTLEVVALGATRRWPLLPFFPSPLQTQFFVEDGEVHFYCLFFLFYVLYWKRFSEDFSSFFFYSFAVTQEEGVRARLLKRLFFLFPS